MKQEMTLRGFSKGTQENYLRSLVILQDHFNRNAAKLGDAEIRSFLKKNVNYLAKHRLLGSVFNC